MSTGCSTSRATCSSNQEGRRERIEGRSGGVGAGTEVDDDTPARHEPLDREACLHVARSCTYFHVRRATRALAEVFDEALRPVGLKGTQFTLLVAIRLAQEPKLGRMAVVLGMDRTTLSRNLRPLERDGLVETKPGRDRRQRLLRLTPAGEQRLSEAYSHWERAQAGIIESLGEDAWNELMAGVRAVHAMAEQGATQ